jgi:hypothetical protein
MAFATETTPTSGEALAAFLSSVIFPVVSAFLVGLVGIILNKVRQKYNVNISMDTQAYLEQLAAQGVARAEELAAQAVKKNYDKFTGREKLNSAMNHILLMAPKITPEKAEALVHAALAKMDGVGATGQWKVK